MNISHNTQVENTWKDLCANPEYFLSDRDPLEDLIIECKHSILTDPLYDAIKEEESIRTGQAKPNKTSKDYLIDNLYAALVAIAAMANNGGGIVLFGVASAEAYPIPADDSPLAERGMTGEDLRAKFYRRETGIRLGKTALIAGIDHEMPQQSSGRVDGHSDDYMQGVFGFSSALWGKAKLFEEQIWYKVTPKDAEDANSYPTVELEPWRKIEWSRRLGQNLNGGVKFLKIRNAVKERTIVALRVNKSDEPVYFIQKSLKKNRTDDNQCKVPFRFPAQSLPVGYKDIDAVELLLGRLPRYRTYLENQRLVTNLDRSRPVAAGSPTLQELEAQRKAILKEALDAKYRQLQECFVDRFQIRSFEFCLRPGIEMAAGPDNLAWVYASQPLTKKMFAELLRMNQTNVNRLFTQKELEGMPEMLQSPVDSANWDTYKISALARLQRILSEDMKTLHSTQAVSCAQCAVEACWNRVIHRRFSNVLGGRSPATDNVAWEEDLEGRKIRAIVSTSPTPVGD